MQLFDTHCHIHEAAGDDAVAERWHKAGIFKPDDVLERARESGVTRLLCVGCTLRDSLLAIDYAQTRNGVWATIGIHPHEAQHYARDQQALDEFATLATRPKVVAVGECGLDYFYGHSSPEDQAKILHFQLALAQKHNLPMVFHVREAFDDFWKIFDQYQNIRGVIHSFTAGEKELGEIMERGLYVGLNGIMTFTKHVKQLDAAKAVPLRKILVETDAPFLTPQPLRGTINEPRHVNLVANFLAELRGEAVEHFVSVTTRNAINLFGVSREHYEQPTTQSSKRIW